MCRSVEKIDDGTLASLQQEFAGDRQALHRIRTVRRQQGVNLRGLARRAGESLYDLEREELPGADLLLSRLYWWQRWLDVPITELLVEPEAGLSAGVLERARFVRLMKTVMALKEEVSDESAQRMIERLRTQLLEIMPELAEVGAWNSIGQRRTLDELGRAHEHTIVLRDWIGD